MGEQASSMAGVPNDKLEPTVIPGCAPAKKLFFRLDYMEKRLTLASKAAQGARDRVLLAQKKAALLREASEAAHAAAMAKQAAAQAAAQAAQQQQAAALASVAPPSNVAAPDDQARNAMAWQGLQ